jgi:hypothetical protein
VVALVEEGVESCGLKHAPFLFVKVPGGVYSLADLPPRLADLSAMVSGPDVTVKDFCITEEAISADEVAAFLAGASTAEIIRRFPEALAEASIVQTAVEIGSVPPATGISHRMAAAFAAKASAGYNRRFSIPTLDEYIAATIFLEKDKKNASEADLFAVSLRGGLLEWTGTTCESAPGTYAAIGTDQIRGSLAKLCFEPAQRVSRLAFRLKMESLND